MTEIFLDDLRKEFGRLIAVDDLSLKIKDEEFICLLGPTGCGKTTTLNCIAGIERPTRGNIYFDDVLVNDLSPQERNVGLVFQNFALFRCMNVYENIAFGLKARKVPDREVKKEMKKIAEMLRLEKILYKNVKELSLDEMQRVGLARAIIIKPAILLLDEPLSQLDALFRLEMRVELKRLQRELGQTSIFVTHDQVEAMSMADRIAVMKDGKLQQYDTPNNLHNKPMNKFVASFIGSPQMNILNCSYEEEERKAFLILPESYKIDVTKFKDVIKANCTSSELFMAIRPEHLKVRDKYIPEKSVEAVVYEIESLGSETIIHLMFGSQIIKLITSAMVKVNVGDKKAIEFEMDGLRIFDKKTDKLIV